MALATKILIMKNYKNLYPQVYDLKNLILAYKKARKRKTKKHYVKEFKEKITYKKVTQIFQGWMLMQNKQIVIIK